MFNNCWQVKSKWYPHLFPLELLKELIELLKVPLCVCVCVNKIATIKVLHFPL